MEAEQLTAREERRCIELTLSGQPCRNKPVAERDRCYIHGLFRALNDGRSTIDIPLLEDPSAILYVYSQVARALAQGAMPPANANGIIRCCKGAERLLEQQLKRERFEERKARQGTQRRAQGSAEDTPHPTPAQTDAVVPPNFDNCEEPGCPIAWPERSGEATQSNGSPVVGDMGSGGGSTACPEREPNGFPAIGDMGASVDEPQPWNVERPLPVVPPPQFSDAPEKFKRTIERVSDQRLDAMLRRDRAIRARGGRATDFYEKQGQGVRCDIRDTYSTQTDSTPRPTSEPLSS